MPKHFPARAALLAAAALTAGCSPAAPPAAAPPAPPAAAVPASAPAAEVSPLVARLRATPDLGTFVELAEAAGMMKVFETMKGATVFAPNNAAFAALPAGESEKLKADRKRLRNLLAGHVTMGTMRTGSIKEEKELEGLSQSRDRLAVKTGAELTVGGARLVQADIEAGDTVLHVIDRVLKVKYDPTFTPNPFGVNLWVLKDGE